MNPNKNTSTSQSCNFYPEAKDMPTEHTKKCILYSLRKTKHVKKII